MSWERRNWGAVWRIKWWMPSCVQPAVASLKEKIENILWEWRNMMPVSILSNLLTKGVSVSSECVCEHPSLSSTEWNLWRGYSSVNLPVRRKSKMKEWNETCRMWGPYEFCVTEVSSSGKVCSWPKDRPPATKCAATRISETAPANYITELQKFCQDLPEGSVFWLLCLRDSEYGEWNISNFK